MTGCVLRIIVCVVALVCFGFAFYACLITPGTGVYCAAPLMMAGTLMFGTAIWRGEGE